MNLFFLSIFLLYIRIKIDAIINIFIEKIMVFFVINLFFRIKSNPTYPKVIAEALSNTGLRDIGLCIHFYSINLLKVGAVNPIRTSLADDYCCCEPPRPVRG